MTYSPDVAKATAVIAQPYDTLYRHSLRVFPVKQTYTAQNAAVIVWLLLYSRWFGPAAISYGARSTIGRLGHGYALVLHLKMMRSGKCNDILKKYNWPIFFRI